MHDTLLAGRESPCRDNTIEGNVGVWVSRFRRLSARDNGEGRAEGQPAPGAFPKPFKEPFEGLFRGFSEALQRPPDRGFPQAFEAVTAAPGQCGRERSG